MKIAVFKMNEEYNDSCEIDEIRENYFGDTLKRDGRYYTPKRKYKVAFNAEVVLFKYKKMYIAKAKKCIDYGELERNQVLGNLTHYYQFDKESIKLIPPIKEELMEQFFEEKKDSQNWVTERVVKKDKEQDFDKILKLGDKESLLESKEWRNYAKKLNVGNLLKEINLYNYENIHTAFFSNFIKENNIYGLGDKPINDFINLLKKIDASQYSEIGEIDSFTVQYQKRYKYKNKNKYIIPDITIDINSKVNKKYRLIIEAKVSSDENIYEDIIEKNEIRQSELYWQCFSGKRNDFICNDKFDKYFYIFLSIKKENIKHYTSITFKDICDFVYTNYNDYRKCKNYDVLKEYANSFHYLCDKRFDFSIDVIPDISMFLNKLPDTKKIYENIQKDIDDIIRYNKSGKIEDSSMVNNYKYLLVLIYNLDISEEEKNKIKDCYNLLV